MATGGCGGRRGLPETAKCELRAEGGKRGRGARTGGCWEDLDEGSWGELPAAPRGPLLLRARRELQMRPEAGREGGSGCLLSTQKEGGLALAQPNQTEKQMRQK